MSYLRMITILTLFFFCGCVPPYYRNIPDYSVKERVIKEYMMELFNIDNNLYQKYKHDPPRQKYQNEDPPTLYVDEKYFQENPRLNKFIDKSVFLNKDPAKRTFNLPVGMYIKKDIPEREDKKEGTVLGKVERIKEVKDIYIDDIYDDFYETVVLSTVELDNGKEYEMKFVFNVELTNAGGRKKEYLIKSAEFDTYPWMVKIGSKWHVQSSSVMVP